MSVIKKFKRVIPAPVKKMISPITRRFKNKYEAELTFWKQRFAADNGTFQNSHYEKIMLGMADEPNSDFLTGKIIADFGCGPRGSLAWAKPAAMRIGIDVLVDMYVDNFPSITREHGMAYLKSTENVVPLPDDFVDVMFTLNAIDHVDNFSQMCQEIIRVVKPGGELICSFNLEEPATVCEPNQLTEAIIQRDLLNHLDTVSYRVSNKGPKEDKYQPFYSGEELIYSPGEEGFLWVRAKKKAHAA